MHGVEGGGADTSPAGTEPDAKERGWGNADVVMGVWGGGGAGCGVRARRAAARTGTGCVATPPTHSIPKPLRLPPPCCSHSLEHLPPSIHSPPTTPSLLPFLPSSPPLLFLATPPLLKQSRL